MTSKQGAEDASKKDGKKQADIFSLLLNKIQNINLNKDNEEQLKKMNKIEKIIIPKWLENFESPFLWYSKEVRGLGSERVIHWALEKLNELNVEETNFSVQRFVSLLNLVLECYMIGEVDVTWGFMEEIEALLGKEVSEDATLYKKVKLSLGHVVSTTRAQLLFLDGEEEKSRKVAQNIIPVKIMGVYDRAALCAIKARYYSYSGYENAEDISVQLARQAMELDPGYEEWKYLLAKMLRLQRRDVLFSVVIPKEELMLLEKAVEENPKPKYLLNLAQVYRECGLQVFRQYRNQPGFFHSELYKTTEDMTKKALNYYKETLELEPNRPSTLRRVGYGIMNLHWKVADYDLALSCLLRSLELSENQMTLHILGTYYHRYGNDNKKALEYYEETAKQKSICGLNDMVRVKYLMDPTYDPCEDLTSGLKWELRRKDRTNLLVQLGGYFLLIMRDFHKSIEYFNEVISEDKDSEHMKAFKCLFLRMNETIDMYHYLANEALLLVQEITSTGRRETITSPITDEGKMNPCANLGYVQDFLDKLNKIRSDLMTISPDPTLIDTLIQKSNTIIEEEIAQKNRRNERQDNQNRRDGNQEYKNQQSRQGMRQSFYSRTDKRGQDNSSEEGCERRGRFSHTNSTEEMCERGEKFSIGNQRNGELSNDNSEGRGHYQRWGRETNENRALSWRQEPKLRPETSNVQNYFAKKEYKNNNNWRK